MSEGGSHLTECPKGKASFGENVSSEARKAERRNPAKKLSEQTTDRSLLRPVLPEGRTFESKSSLREQNRSAHLLSILSADWGPLILHLHSVTYSGFCRRRTRTRSSRKISALSSTTIFARQFWSAHSKPYQLNRDFPSIIRYFLIVGQASVYSG
jgi:hypothetical protein